MTCVHEKVINKHIGIEIIIHFFFLNVKHHNKTIFFLLLTFLKITNVHIDEDIDPNEHLEDKIAKDLEEFDGLITRARAKRFKESLNTFIQKYFEGQEIVNYSDLGCVNVI